MHESEALHLGDMYVCTSCGYVCIYDDSIAIYDQSFFTLAPGHGYADYHAYTGYSQGYGQPHYSGIQEGYVQQSYVPQGGATGYSGGGDRKGV